MNRKNRSIQMYDECEFVHFFFKKRSNDNILINLIDIKAKFKKCELNLKKKTISIMSNVKNSNKTKLHEYDMNSHRYFSNLITFIKLSNAICLCCEIFAFRLIEKQIRDVELNLLLKMLNLNFSNDLND